MNIGMNAMICIAFTKFQPEVMSPVTIPSAKKALNATVVDAEEVSSSYSASSISWSVY